MKLMTRLFILFLILIMQNTTTIHAMRMRSKSKFMGPREGAYRVVYRGQSREELKRQRRLLRTLEDDYVDQLLVTGADLNDDYGGGRPLERVCRLKSIDTLLRHGADPKRCQQSPLIPALLYYVQRGSKEAPPAESRYMGAYSRRCEQEKCRRGEKALRCFDLLLKAWLDPNFERDGVPPLQGVIALDKCFYLPRNMFNALLRLLVWNGANPGRVGSQTGCSAYDYARKEMRCIPHDYLKLERQKYEVICQLLKGRKEDESILSVLPLEIMYEIIRHVVRGPFKPPVQGRAMPPEPQSASASGADISQQHEQQEELPSDPVIVPIDENGSDNDITVSVVHARPARWGYIFGKRLFVLAAVSGIGYWAYKKWQQRKKAKGCCL